MRPFIIAVSAFAFSGCSPSSPAVQKAEPIAYAEKANGVPTTADAHASDMGHEPNTLETPDGYTFHTYPMRVENVRLPTAAEYFWTATASDESVVGVGEGRNDFELGLDGPLHRVIRVTSRAVGNATVTFQRRRFSSLAVVETRSVHFMVR